MILSPASSSFLRILPVSFLPPLPSFPTFSNFSSFHLFSSAISNLHSFRNHFPTLPVIWVIRVQFRKVFGLRTHIGDPSFNAFWHERLHYDATRLMFAFRQFLAKPKIQITVPSQKQKVPNRVSTLLAHALWDASPIAPSGFRLSWRLTIGVKKHTRNTFCRFASLFLNVFITPIDSYNHPDDWRLKWI